MIIFRRKRPLNRLASLADFIFQEGRTKRLIFVMLIFFFPFALTQIARADWTPAKRLTWNTAGSGSPAIAVDPTGNLHLVWLDGRPGNYEIYYR